MTKKFLIFTLCLFILGTFISACGGGGKTTPPNSPFFPIPTPTPATYPLELSKTEFTVNIGETDNITVTLNGEDITQTATYTVDQEAIATVEAGLITGISVGIATVTVHAENAEADKTFTVNVIDPTLPSLEVNPTEVDLIIGEEGAVTITLEGKDVTEDVTYTVDDKSIATVEKGKITGNNEGTANVTVSLTGANSAIFKVNVKYLEVTLNDEVLEQLGYQKVKNGNYYDIKKIEDGTIVTNLEIPATFQDNENKKCKIIAIGYRAFDTCTLQSVTIPDSVTHIENQAFEYCYSLKSITIPNSVKHIGNEAFKSCTSLESVTIGSGLTAIGQIFYNCSNLKNVTISDNVLCIFPLAFQNCTNLTQLTTKNGTKIDVPNGISTNNNVTFIDVKTTSTITSVTIPDGVTEIPDKAFWNYHSNYNSLATINIPNSVTTIGQSAIKNCKSLKSITIPDSVTTIENAAFSDCTSLESITIPNGVTTIGNQAFECCTSLTSVTFEKNSNLESIGYQAFSYCGYSNDTANLNLEVPSTVTTIGNAAFDHINFKYSGTAGDTKGNNWGGNKIE